MGHDQLLKILVDTIFQLFDTIQTNVTFLSTGRIRLIFGDQLDLISVTFSQKISTAGIANG